MKIAEKGQWWAVWVLGILFLMAFVNSSSTHRDPPSTMQIGQTVTADHISLGSPESDAIGMAEYFVKQQLPGSLPELDWASLSDRASAKVVRKSDNEYEVSESFNFHPVDEQTQYRSYIATIKNTPDGGVTLESLTIS
jgi:hypothetical protein